MIMATATAATIDYYQKVIAATEEYLGPAAERFVRRQVEFHLSKKPEDINKADVAKLKESLRVALGLLVDDKAVIEQAKAKFDKIIKEK